MGADVGATQSIARIDLRTHRIVATIPMGPAEEGGIAVSRNGVWFTSDDAGHWFASTRDQRDRQDHPHRGRIHNPIVDGDVLWITSIDHNLVTAVDTRSGAVFATVPTGPQPRFLTAGAGAVWTLNQGDGSLTRIDARKRRAVATIA